MAIAATPWAHRGYNYIHGEIWESTSASRRPSKRRAPPAARQQHPRLGLRFDSSAHHGAGAYICGEETALLESLEGKKGQPRFKPPFPASFGLYGKPTTINNTETFASVPSIICARAREVVPRSWASRTTAARRSSRFPATSIRPGQLRSADGHAVRRAARNGGRHARRAQAEGVIPGGSSAPVLPAEIIMECNMDYDSIAKAGSALGSGAVIVMDETTCMVKALERLSRFYFAESCGQCTPCREGTGWLYRVVSASSTGRAAGGPGSAEQRGRQHRWAAPSARSAMRRPCRCRASSSISGAEFEYHIQAQEMPGAPRTCMRAGSGFPAPSVANGRNRRSTA
jgi:NADH-quinone oxidoreductase subunit F